MTPLGHILSVTAIWTATLIGLRFAVDAIQWLRPLRLALWRLARCTGPTHDVCRAAFHAEVDRLHDDLRGAMIAPWTAVLLFGGCALLGFGIVSLNAGEAAQLVTRNPDGWRTFDIVSNCIGAALAVTGMSLVQAATARHRTAALMVSIALILTGAGVGAVTL